MCQQNKYQACSPHGLLQPLPIPKVIWEEMSMDFIVRLPKSGGKDVILVVVDRLSKYGHFIPLKHPYSARTVAEAFAKEVLRLYGIPASIVSDRDSTFLSLFWKELFKLQGTTLRMSSAYHPETNGQTEVLNRTLETYLCCFSSEQPKMWVLFLPWAEYWYNTSFHGATRCTPFEVVYGRPPPSLARFVPGETMVEAVAQDLMNRDEALTQLRFHLRRAHDQMSKFANRHRKISPIKVGDMVYLKIRPHRQLSMPSELHPKLAARYYGPFSVIPKVGPVAFRLQLPEQARIHPIFHVSQLKLAVGQHQIYPDLPQEFQGHAANLYPREILNRRDVTMQGARVPQILVQWKEGDNDTATWEDVAIIKEQFPDFNLEDKVVLAERSNVRQENKDSTWRVYQRRKFKNRW